VELRVGALEGDVVKSIRTGEFAGTLDGGCGDVHPERTTRLGHARGITGRLAGPTSDVENLVVRPDATGPAQYCGVQPQFGVVVAGAGPVFACGAVAHRRTVTTVGVACALWVIGVHHR
jgi:hypothetical protein